MSEQLDCQNTPVFTPHTLEGKCSSITRTLVYLTWDTLNCVCPCGRAIKNQHPVTNMYQHSEQHSEKHIVNPDACVLSLIETLLYRVMSYPIKSWNWVFSLGHITRYKLGQTLLSATTGWDTDKTHAQEIHQALPTHLWGKFSPKDRRCDIHSRWHAWGVMSYQCSDSGNIQQLDIRVVRVDTALRGNEGTITADPS